MGLFVLIEEICCASWRPGASGWKDGMADAMGVDAHGMDVLSWCAVCWCVPDELAGWWRPVDRPARRRGPRGGCSTTR
jgi:hypothetical protein